MSSVEMTGATFGARLAGPHAGLRTRAKIMREATVLFAGRGFQATTIRDIAQKAGVNIAAINYHFRSKDELYRAVMESALQEWSSEVIAGEDLSADDGLECMVRTIVTALVAPAIERDGNKHLLRLIAWSILQHDRIAGGEPIPSIPGVVARLLAPCLAAQNAQDDATLFAQWLVGQFLLISPVLKSQGPATEACRTSLINQLVALSLRGLKGVHGPSWTSAAR